MLRPNLLFLLRAMNRSRGDCGNPKGPALVWMRCCVRLIANGNPGDCRDHPKSAGGVFGERSIQLSVFRWLELILPYLILLIYLALFSRDCP